VLHGWYTNIKFSGVKYVDSISSNVLLAFDFYKNIVLFIGVDFVFDEIEPTGFEACFGRKCPKPFNKYDGKLKGWDSQNV